MYAHGVMQNLKGEEGGAARLRGENPSLSSLLSVTAQVQVKSRVIAAQVEGECQVFFIFAKSSLKSRDLNPHLCRTVCKLVYVHYNHELIHPLIHPSTHVGSQE